VIATARYSSYAAADGRGALVVSNYPGRLLTRNQAIWPSPGQVEAPAPPEVERTPALSAHRVVFSPPSPGHPLERVRHSIQALQKSCTIPDDTNV
jgi:hypothetical protein